MGHSLWICRPFGRCACPNCCRIWTCRSRRFESNFPFFFNSFWTIWTKRAIKTEEKEKNSNSNNISIRTILDTVFCFFFFFFLILVCNDNKDFSSKFILLFFFHRLCSFLCESFACVIQTKKKMRNFSTWACRQTTHTNKYTHKHTIYTYQENL